MPPWRLVFVSANPKSLSGRLFGCYNEIQSLLSKEGTFLLIHHDVLLSALWHNSRSYDALMCCGYRHPKVDHGKRFSSGKVYINGLEGFWSYAKERLIKFHGISRAKFPLYIKEMEFRYNNRHKNIFNLMAEYLTNFVQNLL